MMIIYLLILLQQYLSIFIFCRNDENMINEFWYDSSLSNLLLHKIISPKLENYNENKLVIFKIFRCLCNNENISNFTLFLTHQYLICTPLNDVGNYVYIFI